MGERDEKRGIHDQRLTKRGDCRQRRFTAFCYLIPFFAGIQSARWLAAQ